MIHCTPAIEVQDGVAMIEEKCTPDFRRAKWILLHEGPVAFDPSPYIPEQQNAGDEWGIPEAHDPSSNMNPSDERG